MVIGEETRATLAEAPAQQAQQPAPQASGSPPASGAGAANNAMALAQRPPAHDVLPAVLPQQQPDLLQPEPSVTLVIAHRSPAGGPDDDEVTSSANDLVELPPTRSITTEGPVSAAALAAVAAAAAAAARGVSTSGSGAGPSGGAAAAGQLQPASPTAGGANNEFKAVLVAKVLTKSDATSKRIILPRIAVEANLPQLASSPMFAFTAADEAAPGRSWALVVKAWANGSNPKPVYVLEGVGDVIKFHRLGAGDALGVLATADGRHYLAVNTPEVRAAAAQPVLSSIAFQQHAEAQAAAADAPASAEGGSRKRAAEGDADGSEPQAAAGGLAHQAGVLVCGRTHGCLRPAGHQGWCQGHGGYARRRTK